MYAVDLVHRNLRPSNVVLTPDGPRLTGFGTWNATDVPGMNPGFLSPEQVLAGDVGSASDIFSLGAVLAFAATGHGPFGSGSSAALMYRLVNSPAQLDDVGAELRTVVASCLEKRPGDRPTASDLLAVLAAIRPQGAGRSWWQAGGPVPWPASARRERCSAACAGQRERWRAARPAAIADPGPGHGLAAGCCRRRRPGPDRDPVPGGGRAHRAAGGNHRGGRWPRFAGGRRLGAFRGRGRGARLVPGLGGLRTFGALGRRHAVDAGRFDHGRTGKPASLGGRTAELSCAARGQAPSGSGSAAPAKSASASASAPSSSSASATAPSSSSAAPAPSSSGAPAPSSSAPSSPASSSSRVLVVPGLPRRPVVICAVAARRVVRGTVVRGPVVRGPVFRRAVVR